MSDNTETKNPITFAQLTKLILNDINNLSGKSSLNTKYSKDQIIRFLENPSKHQKQLRELSGYLYNVSPHYKRLIKYFAGMLRFDYIVEPYDINPKKANIEKLNEQYLRTISVLDNMNIPHEFTKILKYAFREDVFYGYEHETKDSYFIQRLNPDYCRISSIEDGVYNFEFDFAFFKSEDEVSKYPVEFQNKYKLYKKDKQNYRWQELDSKKTICFKVDEEIEYPIPPFSTIFESLYDIDETKRISRVKNKMDNYMILTQKIPISDKTGDPDQFLIHQETAMAFHNMAIQALPEEVGLVTSPMDIEAIKLEKKNTDIDIVAKAERDYFNAAGITQVLFNSDKITGSGISKSIVTDEEILFNCLKQFERWVNRKLKHYNGKYKFRIKFLETTIFNVESVRSELLKSAQYGMPVKNALAATWGLSPSSMMNMAFLENEVLNLPEILVPLSSSHTQSGKNEVGREKKKEDELTESGEKTRDNDSNIRE